MRKDQIELLIKANVKLIDEKTVYLSETTQIDEGTIIYPNVTILGDTKIGKNCKILPGCFLENAIIGDNCVIDSSKISDSEVMSGSTVGPYAHLRMHTVVHKNVRIGNFVELKNTILGEDSKCAHLTYLGDSDVGKNVNIGCGVVTANYDGKKKNRTIIGDNSFIGCNTNLIAPVKIGSNVLIAAGSTITDDVEDDAMGIARARQVNKSEYGKKFINK